MKQKPQVPAIDGIPGIMPGTVQAPPPPEFEDEGNEPIDEETESIGEEVESTDEETWLHIFGTLTSF